MIRLEKAEYLGSARKSFFLGNVVISETEYHQKVSEDWHCHSNNHLSLFLEGGTLEQRKNAEIQAVPGKVLAYPKELPHRNRHTVFPSRNINLEIEDSFLANYGLHFNLSDTVDTSYFLLKMFNECQINDQTSTDSILSLLLAIFESKTLDLNANSPVWMSVIKEILNDRWNENVSLQELSDALGIHPVTVSKGFPKHFHCTLGEYTRRLKVHRSVHLIKSSNKSLTEIALECGFFDQSHFTKTFKSLTGYSPRELQNL